MLISILNMLCLQAPAAVCRPVSRVPAMLVEAKQGGGKLKTRKAAAKRYKVCPAACWLACAHTCLLASMRRARGACRIFSA